MSPLGNHPAVAQAHGAIRSPHPGPSLNVSDRTPFQSTAIEKIRAGDQEAFAAIFHALYPSLCSVVARRVGSPEIAEELVQEVFLRVWERRATLDPERSISGYLYRAAKNQALNHLKHREIVGRSRDLLVLSLHTEQPGAEDDARYAEISGAASDAIERLPTRCREIFLLSRESELSYAEIARLLGISIKTVETQMGRALKSIRARLLPFLGP